MKYIREKGQEFEFEILNTAACEEYHCHNVIEIIYVKSGYIRLRTDMSQMVCDVTEGDYAVIASSDVHRCFCMGTSEYELIRFPVSYQNMLDGNLIRSSFVISRDVLKENPAVFDVLHGGHRRGGRLRAAAASGLRRCGQRLPSGRP